MLQIIVVYFAPFYVFRMQVGTGYRFPAVILAFVINYAAYFAEIYRAGIESIPVGQYEAAEVLGYSKAQTFVKIILPQVVKRVLPPVTNETITLVKDTSMAFTISIAEMFTVAKQFRRVLFRSDQCASPVGSRCVLLYLQSRGGFFHGVSGEEDILLQIGAVRKYGPFGNESCEKKF